MCYNQKMNSSRPSYIGLYESGELSARVERLMGMMRACTLCPRRCGIDRLSGRTGICRVGSPAVVSAFHPHFGEEAVLTGSGGSGTIFMAGCNMTCHYCQNFEISQADAGEEVSTERLSSMMLDLQRLGCHNINFVSPTHQIARIVESLPGAVEGGLHIPLVYNTGGYDSPDTIKLLDGIFDIYLPDLKYGDNEIAMALSLAPSYVEISRGAVLEMSRQAGPLTTDALGLAVSGLIIRHLLLPGGLSNLKEVLGFVADEISINTALNIMDQFRPSSEGSPFPELDRALSKDEYASALSFARERGFGNLL